MNNVIRDLLRCAWFWADQHHLCLIAKVLFWLLIHSGIGPVLLSDKQIRSIQNVKSARRDLRLKELGYESLKMLETARVNMVSIGVFACNRFDLLQKTCDALARFLDQYGNEFPHEVMLFHDGENAEIRTWAEKNPLFDRVLFNAVNHGLSKNINRFWFEESKGKYILNIEEDHVCEFKDNFVRNAMNILDSDENVGCVRLSRWNPEDFRVWNKARKINMRLLSKSVFKTPSGHQYRLLEKTAYDNTSALHHFSALAITGRMKDEGIPRRAQEGEYIMRYNLLWQGARGVRFEDSPFLHIGAGRSAATWGSK